jgi:hypothetical protein
MRVGLLKTTYAVLAVLTFVIGTLGIGVVLSLSSVRSGLPLLARLEAKELLAIYMVLGGFPLFFLFHCLWRKLGLPTPADSPLDD